MSMEGTLRCTVYYGEQHDDLRSSGQSSGHDASQERKQQDYR